MGRDGPGSSRVPGGWGEPTQLGQPYSQGHSSINLSAERKISSTRSYHLKRHVDSRGLGHLDAYSLLGLLVESWRFDRQIVDANG